MPSPDVKGDLHSYLQGARETLVWKLDGLTEYDIRRPLTPTGTNLLGLVKHSAATELSYFGTVFGRPQETSRPRRLAGALQRLTGGAEANAGMWATPDETREEIVARYRSAWEIGDATITELPLEAMGQVPWWGKDGAVTLHRVMVHVTAETQRHAGHADIVRELIDGSAGLLEGHSNLPSRDPGWWIEYHDRVEEAARLASGA
jgi:hypothetical protein